MRISDNADALKAVRELRAYERLTDGSPREANLQGAIVTDEQLSQALYLKDAIMPDGSK